MRSFMRFLIVAAVVALWSITITSCDTEDENKPAPNENQFVSLQSPYLICSTRNPGGVGFDFEYNDEKGGANNLDSLTVTDFEYDLKIRTIKGEKPDGSLGGFPYIRLSASAQAVNYSSIDTTCKGYTDFQNLNSTNIQTYTLQSDDSSFDLSAVTVGNTGSPLMQELLQEYNKLIIGQRWKEAANNDIADDEPIWVIKTREGRIVKFIVTDFPADPAPTSTGYIAIEWDDLP
ncbi:MAG: hypothetical protein EOM06_06540 [Sphingobacteriia bacterium]|nr:hypothetical protein [Sphingobacteriia bacterium]